MEDLSGVRLGHYAELDTAGLAGITDSLGGITVDVPAPYRNRGHDYAVGPQPFDGARAVAYVRHTDPAARSGAPERYQRLVQGPFDRVQELGAFSGLGRLTDLLGSVTSALRVDDTLADEDLVATAWEFRSAGRPEVLVAPSAGGGRRTGERSRCSTASAPAP